MPRLRTVLPALATTTLVSGALVAAGTATAGAANAGPAWTRSAIASAPAAGGVTVKTHHNTLGTYLVSSSGRTLYVFEKDNNSTKSHCYHSCTIEWPPYITHGRPKAAGKVKGHLLGTTKRKNGDKQVTYKGHPLYFFAEDSKAGQTNGEGLREFGAEWNVVNKKGHEIKKN